MSRSAVQTGAMLATAVTITAAGRRPARQSHQANTGVQSQWWLQEIGETSAPRAPTAMRAPTRSPARVCRQPASRPTPSVAAAATAYGPTPVTPSLSRAPSSDWLSA